MINSIIITLAELFSCAELYEEIPWPIWDNWYSMTWELVGFGDENILKIRSEYSGLMVHGVAQWIGWSWNGVTRAKDRMRISVVGTTLRSVLMYLKIG